MSQTGCREKQKEKTKSVTRKNDHCTADDYGDEAKGLESSGVGCLKEASMFLKAIFQSIQNSEKRIGQCVYKACTCEC